MIVEELAPAGGIEAALVTLVEALRPHQAECTVLVVRAPDDDNQYVQQLEAAGVRLHYLPSLLPWARDRVDGLATAGAALLLLLALPLTAGLVFALAYARKWTRGRAWQALLGAVRKAMPARPLARLAWAAYFRAWCAWQRVDLVHVHGYGCGAVPGWALFAAAATGVPVVYSEHGIPWAGLREAPEIARELNQARRIIAVSHAAAKAARTVCSAKPPMDVIYHVVADAGLGRSPRAAEGGLVFGCAAMLRPTKGHRHWIESMPEVLRQFPDSRFELAGDGPERGALEARAHQLGIARRVEFLGQLPNAELRARLREAWDVFVLPSLEEPLGIVIVEAMCAGLPIVATAAGGVVDLVRDGETALLVPPGDSAALAAAQVRLAQDQDLRERLGRAARADYEQGPFTPAAVGSATIASYRAALASKPS